MPGARSPRGEGGLPELRRAGVVTELLFLYECATSEPTQLRPVADRLRVTVQAISHVFRQLRRRGLVEVVQGRYRPTVQGVAWLHETLDRLSQDLAERLAHLHVIRSTRAVAGEPLRAGEGVSLELRDGLLTARPGARGPSRGRARTSARRGTLVEIGELEGIVPIQPATVSVRTISDPELLRASPTRLRSFLRGTHGVVVAVGLEAYVRLAEAGLGPIERFAAAEVAREASRVGVPVTIVLLQRDLPRLLAEFSTGPIPSLDVSPLFGARARQA